MVLTTQDLLQLSLMDESVLTRWWKGKQRKRQKTERKIVRKGCLCVWRNACINLYTTRWGSGTQPVRCPTPPYWWKQQSRTEPCWDDPTAFSTKQASQGTCSKNTTIVSSLASGQSFHNLKQKSLIILSLVTKVGRFNCDFLKLPVTLEVVWYDRNHW